MTGLRAVTAGYLVKLDREISEAEQAVRRAKPDTDDAGQGIPRRPDPRVEPGRGWVRSVTATHATLPAAQAEVRP